MTALEKRDKIIKDLFKPAFKQAGFTVSGTTFTKKEKDFWKIFNIQSSTNNSEYSVGVYLNIGFLFPVGFELREERLPLKPKEYDCQFRIRTDALIGRNQDYNINDDTEKLLADDLQKYILPFFDRYKHITDCLELKKDVPTSWTDCRPYIGLTLIKNGETEKGNEIINSFILQTTNTWANEIDNYRQELMAQK
ncbi:DUF4304 domain-containing protein [Ferruginibacter sp.]